MIFYGTFTKGTGKMEGKIITEDGWVKVKNFVPLPTDIIIIYHMKTNHEVFKGWMRM